MPISDYVLSIYNFIDIENPPHILIDVSLVDDYPTISNLVSKLFLQKDENYSETYSLLKQFIQKQEQSLGPKRFKKLTNNIFQNLIQYTINHFRNDLQLQNIFFHLTYFKKNCWKYLDPIGQCLMIVILIFCNLKMNQISAIQQKLFQCLQIIKNQKSDQNSEFDHLKRLCNIFQGIILFKKGQLKKAKDLFSNIISISTYLAGKKTNVFNQTQKIIQLQLIISSLYMNKIYQQTQNHELASYMLKRCMEFIEEYIYDDQSKTTLLQKIRPTNAKQVAMKIKLTRVESKIQKMNLIKKEQEQIMTKNLAEVILKQNVMKRSKTVHSSSTVNILNNPVKIKKTKPFHFILQNKQNKQEFLKNKQVQNELTNIFIIKDKKKNYFRLKQQTLKYLSKQSRKVDNVIKTKKSQIKQILQEKHIVQDTYNVDEINKKICLYSQQEKALMAQIQQRKWKNIQELQPLKKLQIFLKGFVQRKQYQHAKTVYDFLYGQFVNQSQIKIISMMKRKIHKKNKEAIKRFKYNNIEHQIEFVREKVNKHQKIIMNIYQFEKGENGINIQQEITIDQYQVLKTTQFYYLYYLNQGKLLSFQQQINNLSLKGRYLVKKFIKKMHSLNKRTCQTKYTVTQIYFNYNQPAYLGYILNCYLLIKVTETVPTIRVNDQSLQEHQIQIERIDKKKYQNQNYNVNLKQKFTIKGNKIQNDLINKLFIQKFNEIWKKYTVSIIKIQTSLRRKLAVNSAIKLKQNITIINKKYSHFLYTLRISSEKKTFYIEDLKNKQIFVQKNVNFFQLDFMEKIESKLQSCNHLQEKFKIIQKFLKVKNFANRIFHKSKNLRFFTDFQTQFRKRLCFAKIFKQFLFRGKMRQGSIMFMLTVKQFTKFPRPYCLRIFTLNSNAIISVDVNLILYNKDKIFLQTKLSNLNQMIEILSKNKIQILNKAQPVVSKKMSTRVSIMSNYSFQSGSADSGKQDNEQGHRSPFRRISKNSMFMKFRHKALIRNQDLQILQKIMAQNKYQHNSSSQQNSSVHSINNQQKQKQQEQR